MQQLASLVSDLKFYTEGGNGVTFEREFRKQIRIIFTRHVLKTKKQLLFYVTDLVLQRVLKYRVSDLVLTDSPNGIWTHELIMCDLRVPPSDLLTHYMQSMDKEHISEQQCFERSLALILLWSSILTAQRESADLRSMLYQELCTH